MQPEFTISDSVQLVREACRQKVQLEPYNDECVKKLFNETSVVYREASEWLRDSETPSLFLGTNDVRLLAIRMLAERNKRILLGYHEKRLSLISSIIFATMSPKQKLYSHSTAIEIKFMDDYQSALEKFFSPYQEFVSTSSSVIPPKDLHIQIRCLRSCGVIQTEHGLLNLSANSFHFVRRTDVQNLLDQGLVVHIR